MFPLYSLDLTETIILQCCQGVSPPPAPQSSHLTLDKRTGNRRLSAGLLEHQYTAQEAVELVLNADAQSKENFVYISSIKSACFICHICQEVRKIAKWWRPSWRCGLLQLDRKNKAWRWKSQPEEAATKETIHPEAAAAPTDLQTNPAFRGFPVIQSKLTQLLLLQTPTHHHHQVSHSRSLKTQIFGSVLFI